MNDHAFVRGAPLPQWALLQSLPPLDPDASRPGVLMRLADTQLWAGATPSYLVHRAEQVNDAGALSHIGRVTVQFNPQFQRLLLHRVAILRGSDAVDHTATADVRFLQRESGLEQGVESGVVTATMVLPDVRVGDTLELAYTVEGENPIFAGRYAGWAGWDQSHPVALRRVTLVAPEDRRIHWRWIGDRPGPLPAPPVEQVCEGPHGGLRRLCFEGRHLPAVPFEPYLPRDAYPLRWLQFSEFDSWADVALWARALFPFDAPLPESLQPLVHRLRQLPSPEEQASQALQWVQHEIRYHSVSLGESSHRPHGPAEVVAQRYGDCKDKSLLLARMLQQLGIEAHPALVSAQTRQGPLKLLPSPEAFDHVIVQVRLGGQDFYLDATRLGQSGPLQHMGQGLEDAAVLVVAPGTTQLARVHSPNAAQLFANELFERYTLADFDTPALLESEQHWYGLGAESLRGMLARMDDAQLAHWALGRYERRHPDLALDSAPRVHHDAQLNRLSVVARYRVPHAAVAADGAWTLRFHAANLQGAFAIPESLRRTMPLAVPSFPGRIAYEVEVQWPEGVCIAAEPGIERLDTPHFALHVSRSFRGNLARETVLLQPMGAEVPAGELLRLVEDIRRIDQLVQGEFVVSGDDLQGSPPVPPAAQQQLAAQRQAERAGRAITRGHLQGEDLAGAHCLRAEALAALGDAEAALRDAQAAVEMAPALSRAWSCRGNVMLASGRFAEAAADFGRALQLDGDAVACWLLRGQARFHQGRFEAAAQDFARAARQAEEPRRSQALAWEGRALEQLAGQPGHPSITVCASRAGGC